MSFKEDSEFVAWYERCFGKSVDFTKMDVTLAHNAFTAGMIIGKRQAEDKSKTTCIARTPLRYGSQACNKQCVSNSMLCQEHAALIWPYLLINSTLYLETDTDEEGCKLHNPFK